MTVSKFLLGTVGLVVAAAPLAALAEPTPTPPHACYSGAYKLAGGDFIVISPSDEGTLRYDAATQGYVEV